MRHRSRIARTRRVAGVAAALAAALLAVQQLGAAGLRVAARIASPAAGPAPDASVGEPGTAGAPNQASARTTRARAELAPLEAFASPGAAASPGAGAADGAGGSPPFDPRIELDPLELEPDSGTARISGFDPFAPRALALWRLVDGRSAVMARGASVPGGELRFPRVIAPREGLEVAVAPEAAGPDAPGASLPRAVGARPPAAPYGEVLASAPGEWRLRVRAAEPAGEILLAGVDGAIFARHPLPSPAGPGAAVFELIVELPASDTHVWLAQALPDGHRSAWRLAAPFSGEVEEVP